MFFKLTVVVCTRNRAGLLHECLSTLISSYQNVSQDIYEILVVDNNSTDNTKLIIDDFLGSNSNLRYFCEEKIGLSYSRNTGYKNSFSDWVAYIDDDALAEENFVYRCLSTIETEDFDMFGGMYFPWHKYGCPKWLSDDFGKKLFVRDDVGELPLKGFISGGIMAIKRNVLVEIGGFPIDLGMTGNKISYGEEIYLQKRLKNKGYKLGFDPEWKMLHLVAKYKLNPVWHIKSVIASQRDSLIIKGDKEQGIAGFILLIRSLRFVFIKNLKTSFRQFRQDKRYYWQNLFIDTLRPCGILIGRYLGAKEITKNEK